MKYGRQFAATIELLKSRAVTEPAKMCKIHRMRICHAIKISTSYYSYSDST